MGTVYERLRHYYYHLCCTAESKHENTRPERKVSAEGATGAQPGAAFQIARGDVITCVSVCIAHRSRGDGVEGGREPVVSIF